MGDLLMRHSSMLLELLPRIGGSAATTRARASALVVLWQLSSPTEVACLPPTTLMPHQRRVMRALLVPLDDPDRHVRRLASKLRNEWSILSV
mmetsp:Transcript_405/g.617  ORF Transcript_405/g.617 Transcript_405/m.617 type:complete len:92 (+) Transcript_405:3-278(+)